MIRHKQALYPDCHRAIVDTATLEAVQQKLKGDGCFIPSETRDTLLSSLLAGKNNDRAGSHLRPARGPAENVADRQRHTSARRPGERAARQRRNRGEDGLWREDLGPLSALSRGNQGVFWRA